jgi:periplasmic divalent cation tolerance protein
MPESIDTLAMILTTTPNLVEAESLAELLVIERLAACVQISGPITSVYRWNDVVETTSEFRVVAKTRLSCWPELRRRLTEMHSYDEPQIILVKIDEASEGYAKWLLHETKPS